MTRPNVVFVFADQWRAQATGYAGNPDVQTPHLDELARESINCTQAISGCPVCSPYRASLLTGQYPLTHGVFVNDVCLQHQAISLADAFAVGGYHTAYIGKWHLDGPERSAYIPPERRQGFGYWKVLECTHDYEKSAYYAGDSDKTSYWDGYDAIAQTRDACAYIRNHAGDRPFLLVLSWGPPHDPYHTAPEEFQRLYNPETLELRPNVPADDAMQARERLAGYYAHCTVLDACVGQLHETLREEGIAENTLLIFTSDHGDMLGSQGHWMKQRPWEESVRVPFLLYYPAFPGWQPREVDVPIDAPDILPTLLGLCDLPIPESAEGLDFSKVFRGESDPSDGTGLLTCVHPFGNWNRPQFGGTEYRGLRTTRYTYVRTLQGPWLLYDNERDFYQLQNLVHNPAYTIVQQELEEWLQRKLNQRGDAFLPGMDYIRERGYPVDETGTVPFTW